MPGCASAVPSSADSPSPTAGAAGAGQTLHPWHAPPTANGEVHATAAQAPLRARLAARASAGAAVRASGSHCQSARFQAASSPARHAQASLTICGRDCWQDVKITTRGNWQLGDIMPQMRCRTWCARHLGAAECAPYQSDSTQNNQCLGRTGKYQLVQVDGFRLLRHALA